MISYVVLFLLFLSPETVSGSNLPNSDNEDMGESEKLTRIVGGTTISSSVPYFVWLENCGATMIHHDVALTAAHCATGKHARIGIQSRDDLGGGKTRIQAVKRHPLYNEETYDYDFALIKFGGWFPDGTVQLNRSDSTPTTGDDLTIMGFGGSTTLKMGRVSYVHPAVCSMAWGEFGYEIREEIVLCAADSSGADACNGDSGGPLMDGKVQVGVISSGSGCNGLLPTTYARVSAAIGWIETQVCDMSAFPPDHCPEKDGSVETTVVRVDIKLDDYPEDIVWRIHRDSSLGAIVTSGDGYSVRSALESKFVSLQDGQYVFAIEDQSGFADGLGGSGSYKVVQVNSQGKDTKTLVNGGGGFGATETTSFTIGDRPTLPPTPTITNTTAQTSMPTSAPTESATSAPTTAPVSSFQPSLRPVAPSESPVTSSPTGSPTVEETISSDVETPDPSEPSIDETPDPTQSPVSPTESPTVTEAEATDEPTATPTESPVEPSEEEEEKVDGEDPDNGAAADVLLLNEDLQEEQYAEAVYYEMAEVESESEEAVLDIDEGGRKLQLTTDPTSSPTDAPETDEPTTTPTSSPTSAVTSSPTSSPTLAATPEPTPSPTASQETDDPTDSPTDEPTDDPTVEPTASPFPSLAPSISVMPSTVPSISSMPSDIPTLFQVPTTDPPSAIPTALPTTQAPSLLPSSLESDAPSSGSNSARDNR